MRTGHVGVFTHERVAGWAFERPGARLTVTITVDGVAAGAAVADRPRRDLQRRSRFGDGGHGFQFDFHPPLDPAAAHDIAVRFDDGELVPNGERQLAAITAPKPAGDAPGTALDAILVTAPGRSGTTLLMSLLASSPEIVVAELVPFELRLLSYYATLFTVMTSPADLAHSTHPDKLQGDGYHFGFNPFRGPDYAAAFRDRAPLDEYYGSVVPNEAAAMIRRLVTGFYARLAADQRKPARFLAEKNNNLHRPTREFVRRAFPGMREIVIVRDLRDVLCSHLAYFGSAPELAFRQLTHSCHELLRIRREAAFQMLMIRYEDMLRGEPSCFDALSTLLGTRITPQAKGEPAQIFQRHGTSTTPEATIGRWRNNLDPALAARCAREWKTFLEAFGYEQ